MPALGMAQESGKLLAWLKQEGETVTKGEPLMEIETDKAAVEIEASASGLLGGVSVEVGQDVPVGQVIAWILEPGEKAPATEPTQSDQDKAIEKHELQPVREKAVARADRSTPASLEISPVAKNIAQEHGVDLNLLKPNGARIQKADVLAFIDRSDQQSSVAGIVLASPKARRMAGEYGLVLDMISGSGPDGAVLAADVALYAAQPSPQLSSQQSIPGAGQPIEMSRGWTVMAERLTEAWRTIPHFYLEREINASQMISWRNTAQKNSENKITFTNLLLKAGKSVV